MLKVRNIERKYFCIIVLYNLNIILFTIIINKINETVIPQKLTLDPRGTHVALMWNPQNHVYFMWTQRSCFRGAQNFLFMDRDLRFYIIYFNNRG